MELEKETVNPKNAFLKVIRGVIIIQPAAKKQIMTLCL
jgi:hypothetical protein